MEVACFTPSGPAQPHKFARIECYLSSRGWKAILAPLPKQRNPLPYLAASDAERLRQLHWALGHGKHEGAWTLRGGYGMARLLPLIRWDELRPRWLMGFSDQTALLWALHLRGWTDLHHGPNLESLVLYDSEETREALLEPWTRLRGRTICPGEASGAMVGGNLCVLASLCGTPWQFAARDKIVYLEEVREDAYRMDSSLTQLLHSGAMHGCRGVVLGQFADCGPSHQTLAILRDRLTPLEVPVLWGLPMGHGDPNLAFQYGGTVTIDGHHLLRE